MAKRMTFKQASDQLQEASANLNAYGAVVGALEAGTIRGGRGGPAQQIIKIAQAAMQRELKLMDAAEAELARMAGQEPPRRTA